MPSSRRAFDRMLAEHVDLKEYRPFRSPMRPSIVDVPIPFERRTAPLTTTETPETDILLVTATPIETKAVLQAFHKLCKHKHKCDTRGQKTYFELGVVNSTRIFLVQSGVGNYSSLSTVQEAIRELKPCSVIMTGIAFGVDPHTQRIGDVVVAETVVEYESLRWGTAPDGTAKIVSRGNSLSSSKKLLDRFSASSFEWTEPSNRKRRGRLGKNVHIGTVISGQKLVDNIGLRDLLLSLVPGAACGDMESFGVYFATQNARIDCITVKGISDFADGNKSIDETTGKPHTENQDQKTAANNAIDYIIHVLRTMKFI